jgi:hypothetical protein
MPLTIDPTTAVVLTIVAAGILAVTAILVRHGHEERPGWEREHAADLDQMMAEHRSGELPTLDALAAGTATATADRTVARWYAERAQVLPAVEPADYRGRHRDPEDTQQLEAVVP